MMSIRKGTVSDLPRVLELVIELATFERAPEQVINTVKQMERDGFGESPAYGFFVAENENGIVGLALYYWRYSTWKGKRLWLEDIIVTESERGKGIGKLLFEKMLSFCLEQNSEGMMWQVLDWNTPAIDFYKKYGADVRTEWLNCTLERNQIEELVKERKIGVS
jgi:GNAT superfamily N-acetyltransferase